MKAVKVVGLSFVTPYNSFVIKFVHNHVPVAKIIVILKNEDPEKVFSKSK